MEIQTIITHVNNYDGVYGTIALVCLVLYAWNRYMSNHTSATERLKNR